MNATPGPGEAARTALGTLLADPAARADALADPGRARALLKALPGVGKKHLGVLLAVADEGLPAEIAAGPATPAALGPWAARVEENGFDADLARWAVESWALALGQMMAPEPPAPAPAGDSVEKPANFFLGHRYDVKSKAPLRGEGNRIDFDAKNLTTHGVVVGMTGSGKTGLSIALLEEVAIDGIPAIIIDPKGDLCNLLLQFPELKAEKFAEWLNPEDARQRHLTVPQYAEQLAQKWREGLADSEQTVDRIKYAAQGVGYRVYTPGSEAGLPVSILRTFAAPKGGAGALRAEDLTQKINATTTALLGLSGISADPVQSREHVLISQLLQHAWGEGRDLDLHGLIKEIQSPPIRTVGAYNLETFFPAKERVKFASQLNNVLASPVFQTWTKGEALDVEAMLFRGPGRRPQHCIFYLAHLDDAQRMFFVTLLLEEVLAWTRRQAGTTSLRALVYFDEVFGYLPPHPGNPPSKQPMLTLLKQARAFGVGVLLATQNPVDLDYKALSNAGTWFVGKLQTERDKARLLDGLETVAAEYGARTDRAALERTIASLGNRVFLLHNINAGEPVVMRTRWALSFLRGPMTRDEVSRLTAKIRAEVGPEAVILCNACGQELPPGVADRCPHCGGNPWAKAKAAVAPVATWVTGAAAGAAAVAVPVAVAAPPEQRAPVLPPDVTQFYFAPSGIPRPAGAALEYNPFLLGFADVAFLYDRRGGREHRRLFRRLAFAPSAGHPADWERASECPLEPQGGPMAGARWANVPDSLDTGRKLQALAKSFADYVYGTQKLPLWENRELELISDPGETEEAFRRRCVEAADAALRGVLTVEREKFKPRFWADPFEAHLPDDPQYTEPTVEGRDAARFEKLKGDYESKKAEITAKWKQAAAEVAAVQVKPRKSDVRVSHFGLAWVPYWTTTTGRVQA